MAFNPRAPRYLLREMNPIQCLVRDKNATDNPLAKENPQMRDRLDQSPLDIATAGFEVIDRSLRNRPFDPFMPQPMQGKHTAPEAQDSGADYRLDRVTVRVGEM